jgi:hypothetical protein
MFTGLGERKLGKWQKNWVNRDTQELKDCLAFTAGTEILEWIQLLQYVAKNPDIHR